MKRLVVMAFTVLLLFFLFGCAGEPLTSPEPVIQETTIPLTPPTQAAHIPDQEENSPMITAQRLLDTMTLEERIAQLFFLECPIESEAAALITQRQPGGILLFAYHYQDADHKWLSQEELTARLTQLQSISKIPMFVGSDEEGGTVTRASQNPNLFPRKHPSLQSLLSGGIDNLLKETLQYNTALRELGINVNFAPVCDVSADPDNYIYDRSFGTDAHTTASYIAQMVHTLGSAEIGCVLKHFPGYGDNVDTHTGIAVDERPMAQFEQEDFLPFVAGMEQGAPFVLVSHNIVTAMDEDHPASLSPAVHHILRDDLGFEGIIITDDLDMDAVKAYAEDGTVAVMAILAGNDMVITRDAGQIDAVIEAVRQGTITQERIDQSCLRVLQAKLSLGIIGE